MFFINPATTWCGICVNIASLFTPSPIEWRLLPERTPRWAVRFHLQVQLPNWSMAPSRVQPQFTTFKVTFNGGAEKRSTKLVFMLKEMKLPARGDSIEIIFYFFSLRPFAGHMGSESESESELNPLPALVLIAYYIFVFMPPLRVCLWDQNQMQRHVHLSKVKPRSSKPPDLPLFPLAPYTHTCCR